MSQKLVRYKPEIRDLEIELEFISNKLERNRHEISQILVKNQSNISVELET